MHEVTGEKHNLRNSKNKLTIKPLFIRLASTNLRANPFADFISPNPHNPMRYEGNVTIVIIFKTRKIELERE